MSPTSILGYALTQTTKTETCIEIGTYYAGWTLYLSQYFSHVYTFQTSNPSNLQHVADTELGIFNDSSLWKKAMRKALPPVYHGYYDFNLLAQNINKIPNATLLLEDSPPTFKWSVNYDLCVIDITRDPAEHLKQYSYWKNYANPGAIMVMGLHYNDKDEYPLKNRTTGEAYEHNQEYFLKAISSNYEIREFPHHVLGEKYSSRYIFIKL